MIILSILKDCLISFEKCFRTWDFVNSVISLLFDYWFKYYVLVKDILLIHNIHFHYYNYLLKVRLVLKIIFVISLDDGMPILYRTVDTTKIKFEYERQWHDFLVHYPSFRCLAGRANLTLPIDYEVKYIYFFVNCYWLIQIRLCK